VLYLVAGIVVALVAGVVAARWFAGPPATVVEVSTAPASAAEFDVVPASTQAPAPDPIAAQVVEAPVPSEPLSEADLMAVLPEEEVRAAAAAAEWFVTDYFTVDGGSGSRERVAARVPDLVADMLPHGLESEHLAYVEWASAVRVEPMGPGSYDVTVVYGSVASRSGGLITRQPVRTVGITARFTDVGGPQIVGLPRPQPTIELLEAGVAGEPAPEAVVAAALIEASVFGDEPEAVGAYRAAGAWRVVVLVGDPSSGIRWPFEIVVDR
jgi:hypothetical protein